SGGHRIPLLRALPARWHRRAPVRHDLRRAPSEHQAVPGMTSVRGGTRIRGGTRTVGIIGWPVIHSLSPAIHNAAFAALDLDWAYVPLPVAPGDAGGAVAGLRALGFAGANVTMPHKSDVADVMDTLTDDARRLHAVNTVLIGERLPDGLN